MVSGIVLLICFFLLGFKIFLYPIGKVGVEFLLRDQIVQESDVLNVLIELNEAL